MAKENTMLLTQRPRLSVSLSRKINLGNYESTDIFISIASDTDNDVVDRQVRDMLARCEEVLNEKVKALEKKI